MRASSPENAKSSKLILYSAVILSLVAALIHFWVAPEHFDEWWGYGAFFLASGICQALYSPALLLWPRPSLFLVGIVGNLAIIVLWAVTRSVGVPFFGPAAGELESVGEIDVTSKLLELVLIIALMVLWRRWPKAGISRPMS